MAVLEHTSRTYRPSERIEQLRARALNQGPELFQDAWQRAYLYLEGWMGASQVSKLTIPKLEPECSAQPLPLRNAEALGHVIECMPVRLYPGELLVGQHSNGGDSLNFRAELGENYLQRFEDCPLSDEERENLERWVAAEPFAWQRLAPVAPMPRKMRLAEQHGAITVWGTDLNHSIRAYDKVLRLGFSGLRAEVEERLAGLSTSDPQSPHARANLLAWRRLCDAALTLGPRHAAEARRRARLARKPERRREWEAIAEVCERVPNHPARTFREALQALWFAHMITAWEDGVNANGIGRIDQFLWPYLEQDLAEGRLDWDQAAELLAALWCKLYQTYDVQQMMIGGQTPEGEDATNPLSYLVLDVTEGLGFVRCLSARLHRRTPREFVARCVDLLAHGGGIPFFFNDEALIPALVSRGISLEDARGYAAIGCIEITIPGKANPHAVSHWINFLVPAHKLGILPGIRTDREAVENHGPALANLIGSQVVVLHFLFGLRTLVFPEPLPVFVAIAGDATQQPQSPQQGRDGCGDLPFGGEDLFGDAVGDHQARPVVDLGEDTELHVRVTGGITRIEITFGAGPEADHVVLARVQELPRPSVVRATKVLHPLGDHQVNVEAEGALEVIDLASLWGIAPGSLEDQHGQIAARVLVAEPLGDLIAGVGTRAHVVVHRPERSAGSQNQAHRDQYSDFAHGSLPLTGSLLYCR
jgi:hypothetical protein